MKKKILIVDDDPDVRLLIATRLESMGYDTIGAEDGQTGLDLARKDPPDLILLDLMLPKLNGYKVCRMLKFDKSYEHVPIVIISSKGSEEDKKLADEVGADGYITKPFEKTEIAATIQKLLGSGNPPV